MKKFTFVLGITALALTSCGQAALSPEVFLPVAQALYTANESEEFVSPTKATFTTTSKYKSVYPGEEPIFSTSRSTLRFDAAAGYYSDVGLVDGKAIGVYSYVKDGTYYLARVNGETKEYAAVPFDSDEAALALATAIIEVRNDGGRVALEAKGLGQLQTLIQYCEQITLNTDSDPKNDVNDGYTDKYKITLSGSASGKNMDVTLKLTGRASPTTEGHFESTSLDIKLKYKFNNGYLTYNSGERVHVSSATLEGETKEIRGYSKSERTLSYGNVSYVYPDLTDGFVERSLEYLL